MLTAVWSWDRALEVTRGIGVTEFSHFKVVYRSILVVQVMDVLRNRFRVLSGYEYRVCIENASLGAEGLYITSVRR